MKEIDPPTPLDAGADTPEELREVLRALGREGPGRGTLERVARELGPYMDAAPGLSMPVVAAARTGGKLLVARALAALLAIGGTAYLVQRGWPSASTPAPVAPRAQLPSREVAEPVREPVLPVVEPPVVEVREPTPVAAVVAPAKRARHGARKRLAASIVETPAVEPSPVEAVTAEAAPVATAPARVAEVEEPPAQKIAEPPPDEFALLWQARERLRRDPAGALALLDTHAGRFANGQLAPEREVLAVEALRVLGRTSEADARLQRFRARYPGSIHLRRLQQGR